MKKLTIVFFLSIFFIIVLIGIAFLYIDLSGHKEYFYNLLDSKDEVLAVVSLDRYVTEDKIVFKSKGTYPNFLKYSEITEKIFFRKKDMSFMKFVKEAYDEKGQKQLVMITQEEEKADFLFLEYPKFFNQENIKIEYNTTIFSPDDVMLYKALTEKYNFWTKGAQFFKIAIPLDEIMPPLIDKIGVRYLQDEYIPIMGRRVETESYIVSSKILPKAKIFLAKYNHEILALEIKKLGLRFVLTNPAKNPAKRIKTIIDKLSFRPDYTNESETKEEVFFESDGQILAGRLFRPSGGGTYNAVLIVPKDGPVSKKGRFFVSSLAERLSREGFVVMVYDSQGQGKSQGVFTDLDDKKRIKNIVSAVSYLEACPYVNKSSINVIGHEGGGTMALKAVSNLDSVAGCVLVASPPGMINCNLFPNALREYVQSELNMRGYETFNEEEINTLTEAVKCHIARVVQDKETFYFFEGIKIPFREYREFLLRSPYDTILSFSKPVLAVFGKDDKYFNLQVIDSLKEKFTKSEKKGKIIVLKGLEDYTENNVYLKKVRGYGFGKTFLKEDVLALIVKWLKETKE